jgi:hypothetical protein
MSCFSVLRYWVFKLYRVDLCITEFDPCNFTHSGKVDVSAKLSDIQSATKACISTTHNGLYPGLRASFTGTHVEGSASIFEAKGKTTWTRVGVTTIARFLSLYSRSETLLTRMVQMGKRKRDETATLVAFD